MKRWWSSRTERDVIADKATRSTFARECVYINDPDDLSCKECGAPLAQSQEKCESQCGWPPETAEQACTKGPLYPTEDRQPDNTQRTDINYIDSGKYFGHVFMGDNMTKQNSRRCVNTLSMKFGPRRPLC